MVWRVLILMILLLAISDRGVYANEGVRRMVLAVGANDGGESREVLQYAVSDARNFVQVMETMGGVGKGDHTLLSDPSAEHLDVALRTLREQISSVEASRREVLIYYSGHADERGLRLGEALFSYERLRDAMDDMGAEVQIAILDACASGAITRLKGGQRQKAFMVDASSDMRGYAFLTSSSEDETAQESDAIGASFFTHYLVSGLRGAADVTGDGQVTLNEAYQFAFQNTLERTERTQGGAQHPAYDIKMTGTGDVVVTDVRQTSVGLILGETLQGRFFIRNDNRQLIAELFKPAGRLMELGLEPGTYQIHLAQEAMSSTTTLDLETGQRKALDETQFDVVARDPTVMRGGAVGKVARRSRLEMRFGYWKPKGASGGPSLDVANPDVRVSAANIMSALSYAYWIEEHKSIFLSVALLISAADVTVGQVGNFSNDASVIFASLIGMKYYWLSSSQASFRPYAMLSAGPYFGTDVRVGSGRLAPATEEVQSRMAFGGQVGGGVDLSLGRRFMTGIQAGYHLNGMSNFSGLEVSLSLSFVFGKGAK